MGKSENKVPMGHTLLLVTLDEIRKLVEQTRSFEAGDVLAPGGIECIASSSNRQVDIFGRG